MNANIIVAIVVGALFLFVVARLLINIGRVTSNNPDCFPHGTGTIIAPPIWSADSALPSSDTDAECKVDDGGWSDSSSDSGSCDFGDGGSSGD